MKTLKTFIALSFIVSSFWACKPKTAETPAQDSTTVAKQETSADDFTIIPCERVGKITPNMTEDDIIKLFGKENTRPDTVYVEGSIGSLATTVLHNGKDALTISWQEEKPPFKTILNISIIYPESPYRLSNGAKVGMTLKELVALNENQPIEFSGFDWDFGGFVQEFKDGTPLKTAWRNCVGLRLEISDISEKGYAEFGVSQEEGNSISGDQTVSSTNKVAQKLPIVVSEINLNFGERKQ